MSGAPRVRLEIAELHLHGFAAHTQQDLVAALERELGQLLAAGGGLDGGELHLDRLRIDCAPAPRGLPPGTAAGRHAARSLHLHLQHQLALADEPASSEPRVAAARPSDSQPAAARPSDSQSAAARPSDPRLAAPRRAEPRPADGRPSDPSPAAGPPADPSP